MKNVDSTEYNLNELNRLRLVYDEYANKDNGDESYRVLDSPTEKTPKTTKISKEIFMELCDLVDSVASLSRRCVLHDALGNSTDTPTLEGSGEAETLQHLLAISSTRGCKLANITPALSSCLPPFLRAALERWNNKVFDDCFCIMCFCICAFVLYRFSYIYLNGYLLICP